MHRDVAALAGLFATSGTLHFVHPRPFESIVPHRLPRKRALVYASGAAELLCAVGLLHPRTRGTAGWASVVLLLAVFPANVQMAVDARAGRSTVYRVGTLARLPMQLPLIRAAWRAARHQRDTGAHGAQVARARDGFGAAVRLRHVGAAQRRRRTFAGAASRR